jgi:hypothetical protein
MISCRFLLGTAILAVVAREGTAVSAQTEIQWWDARAGQLG